MGSLPCHSLSSATWSPYLISEPPFLQLKLESDSTTSRGYCRDQMRGYMKRTCHRISFPYMGAADTRINTVIVNLWKAEMTKPCSMHK